ncbi:zinc-ribbon domain-containing protein [Cohaesibacter celericrescens]|uniref:zinc-ribbon domain-containing protein n=1 Tax=Cohaesibacter celericrescens TaxID=2067669 RepID=UPI003569EC45
MKITCPNCSTSYQVPDDYIGTDGRAVRCANCSETWHAEPVAPIPEAANPVQEAPAEGPEGGPEDGAENSQDDIDSLFDSPGDEEQSQDDIDALFDSPAAGEEQDQDGIDALFDSPSAGEEQDQDGIDALFDAPSAGEEQDQDGIDALFDSPAADTPQPDKATAGNLAKSNDPFVIKGGVDEGYESPVVDLMDAAAFEAQKVVARGKDIETSVRRRRRKRRRPEPAHQDSAQLIAKREWMLGGGALGMCLVVLITLFSAPKFWVRTLPDLASLYGLVGMDVNVAGVDFDMVDVKFLQQGGAPVISVETELVNPGLDPVLLPSVQFSVLGNNDTELYSWAIGPDHVGLGPGERKRIETSIAAPSQAKYISLRVFHQ